MTRKTLALILPTLLLIVALMAGTTMAIQTVKVKPDTPGVTIIKEVTTLKLKIIPPTHRIDPVVLDPYSGILVGPFTINSNQELGVIVYWSPSYATLVLGVINANTLQGYGVYVENGFAAVIFNPGAGSWYIFIYNDSPYYVTATIDILIINNS